MPLTPQQAIVFRDIVVGFIENEAKSTVKVIAALPARNRDYKPDPKSRTGWDLAAHIALSDAWFASSIVRGAFVWAGDPPYPEAFTDPQAIAAWYERSMAEHFGALRALDGQQLVLELDFFGKKAPAVLWLLMFNSHMVHHRGQLAAYLRAAGGRVPAIYGVSADENLLVG